MTRLDGTDAERFLRSIRHQAARRAAGGGALVSRESLKQAVWDAIPALATDAAIRALQRTHASLVATLTDIHAIRAQRDILTEARADRGGRFHLGSVSGWGDEADKAYADVMKKAQAEALRHTETMRDRAGVDGDAGLRDRIVKRAAQGATVAARLASTNAALVDLGLPPIARSTLFKILR